MDTNALHIKASDFLAEGSTEQAKEIYEKILQIAPNDEAALSSLMDIYQETDRLRYYLTRANYNIVNGKLEYGITDCKKALSIDASNIEAREKLARLYKVTNKPLKAIDEFTKIIELNDLHIQSYMELIDLYTKENALESAVQIAIKADEKFKGEANFNDVLAKLYFDLGNYEEALKTVGDLSLKTKILLQAEKNEEAKSILEEMNPDSMEKEQKALYYLLYAQYNYNIAKYTDAFSLIDKYAQIMGPNALVFQMRALCYEALNDEFMAYYNFGYMNKALNKPDEALTEFSTAYSINPKNKDVLIELAKLYEANKEKYTAIDFWHKVYDLDKDEQARAILADFYLKEGDSATAEQFGAKIQKETKSNDEPYEEAEGLIDKIINLFSKKKQ
ncbi:MAG: hypothetical protein LUE64_00370 [Candidatus Gastranaerophilales bacterium]|nr:hypothetical protein [Candidatus Gastranaerophilales bacterium]